MKHEDLRKLAVKWLTNKKHCGVVLSEIVTACSEIPDAVGWQAWVSYLVECKTNRADFLAQRRKCWMRTGRGVGSFRYFLAPEGVLETSDMADSDWGLLVVSPSGRVKLAAEAARREPCREDEVRMLVSALRRVKQREFLVIVPEPDAVEEQ